MTNDERIRALQSYGYTHRQATFLCTVALHSGYFLRRQYHKFWARNPCERRTSDPTGLAKGHIQIHGSANRTLIYQPRRPLRLRGACRPRTTRISAGVNPLPSKTKLMGLDFVLAHPQHRYLATEDEKLDFFCSTLGLERNCLFARGYRSRRPEGQTCFRYFRGQIPHIRHQRGNRSSTGGLVLLRRRGASKAFRF